MKRQQIKTLKGGELLAKSVLTDEEEVLIVKGTVLKPEYLELLSFLGVDAVCIEDPYQDFQQPHRFMKQEEYQIFVNRVQKILENHIYDGREELRSIEPLAEDMIHAMMQEQNEIVIDYEERTGNLYEHTVMVTFLAIAVAKKLKLSEQQIRTIAIGSLLHDLGLRYITVPYINYDQEKSTASELFEFKKHSILAYSVLEHETWLSAASKKMILSHHERWNGSGFPLHQKSREIECNILQACDAFDCMVSGMECQSTNVQAALQYMIEMADVLYDKKVVKAIVKIVATYPVGTTVKLNTGCNGIVIGQTTDTSYPVIAELDENGMLNGSCYNLKEDKKISILSIKE